MIKVLKFGADWCASCKAAEPMVKSLTELGYTVENINIGTDPETGAKFGVRGLPTFLVINTDTNEVLETFVGSPKLSEMVSLIEKHTITG